MKRSPLRKRSKRPIARLKAEADRVFSIWIRKRDDNVCYTCGNRFEMLQAGHFISRTRSATRFDEMNVHAQCVGCNVWKRGNVGLYSLRLIRDYGQKKFRELLETGEKIHQFTEKELEAIIEKYTP